MCTNLDPWDKIISTNIISPEVALKLGVIVPAMKFILMLLGRSRVRYLYEKFWYGLFLQVSPRLPQTMTRCSGSRTRKDLGEYEEIIQLL